MNTAELAEKLAAARDITKSDARAIIDETFSIIVDNVNAGEDVSLNGVGKFSLKKTKEREGRNPATGESMTIKASRKLAFKPAKAVADKLNG